ncbi:hypothetical protein [Vallitalea guaymasensis]|uniref:Uncharacterized protein n=1 Tax=Vallitalea guaymasensis TaxID=1185412 RepID=A0A8J8M776_9FIRM|nr:hypothetical protein [Vallitalea guaymasensis]QUH27483.1 hypothetical protein HYG85_00515 [Vallitalea guaymasensis]
MKKIVKIIIVLNLIFIILVIIGNIMIDNKKVKKIGIISVWSDFENKQYAKKEEIIVDDKKTIRKILDLIRSGNINKNICLDRLPAEYELKIYYNKYVIDGYYWYNEPNYNLHLDNTDGEISINGEEMDKLILSITGERNREKIVSPYGNQ